MPIIFDVSFEAYIMGYSQTSAVHSLLNTDFPTSTHPTTLTKQNVKTLRRCSFCWYLFVSFI